MKIIGGTRDYYDFAGSGIDESITFDRREDASHVFAESFGLPEAVLLQEDWRYFNSLVVKIAPFHALVGGFGIPGIRIVESRRDQGDRARYFYDMASYSAAVSGTTETMSLYDRGKLRKLTNSYERFLGGEMADLTQLCIEKRIVTGMLRRSMSKRYTNFHDAAPGSKYASIPLIDIGLDTRLPGYEAHMLISRFVGGILPGGLAIAEPSDRTKIVKAGFDLKTSFRKGKMRLHA